MIIYQEGSPLIFVHIVFIETVYRAHRNALGVTT
jgi:hypothetical protein